MRNLVVVVLAAVAAVPGCSGKKRGITAGIQVGGEEAAPPAAAVVSASSPYLRHRMVPASFFARFPNGLPVAGATVWCQDAAERQYSHVLSRGGFSTGQVASPLTETGEILEPKLEWCRVVRPDGQTSLIKAPNVYRSDDGDGWRVVLTLENPAELPGVEMRAPDTVPGDWPGSEGGADVDPAVDRRHRGSGPADRSRVHLISSTGRLDPQAPPRGARQAEEIVALYYRNAACPDGPCEAYHRQGCRFVYDGAEALSLSAAASGRRPCNTCRPPRPEEVPDRD